MLLRCKSLPFVLEAVANAEKVYAINTTTIGLVRYVGHATEHMGDFVVSHPETQHLYWCETLSEPPEKAFKV
jgi:hypothetical protein